MEDTEYAQNGRYREEVTPVSKGASTSIGGFSAYFKDGKPVIDENGIFYLITIKEKFDSISKEFSVIINGNALENMVGRRGISEEEFENAKKQFQYAASIYNLLSENEISIDQHYRFAVREEEYYHKLINTTGIKPSGREGRFPIFDFDGKIIEKQKQEVVRLADEITKKSQELMRIYTEQVLLRKRIINGNHEKFIGGI